MRNTSIPYAMLRERRLAHLDAHGYVIIDDLGGHPLLDRMEAAARELVRLSNSKAPVSLDTSCGYVHRTSALRGESKPPLWCAAKRSERRTQSCARVVRSLALTLLPTRRSSRGSEAAGRPFSHEEAWAIRGALHPAWRAVVPDQGVFCEFLSSPESFEFLERWSPGLTARPEELGLPDCTLFVNPRESDFSEGWHRDTR